ncbi:MAG: sulfur transferase domain-containing protein [Hyphomicrobiaceae bacterium]|nr:sulfur transferase domain-containing protein [Hyphomicrobiaceae bacterium]
MAGLRKRTKRAIKRVTMAWRHGLISRSPAWLRRSLGPTASYLDMMIMDHGLFRLVYLNKHRLSAEAWRSAQPGPGQLARIKALGVRTIVNLRGERECGSFWNEERACRELGLNLVNYTVRSRAAPSREEIRGAAALFGSLEYPILMHCKSGADRAGLMSVLYRHFREGVPIAEAKSELSLRYGHIRQADTGILDYFFERYLADTAERPMPLLEWVDTIYDPDELKASFLSNGWANRFVDQVLQRE